MKNSLFQFFYVCCLIISFFCISGCADCEFEWYRNDCDFIDENFHSCKESSENRRKKQDIEVSLSFIATKSRINIP
jgi:hypothetical protein